MLKQNLFFILFSLILVSAIIVGKNILLNLDFLIPQFWLVFIFIALVTLIAFNVCLIGIKQSYVNSSFVILSANSIKLLFCMFFAMFYLETHKVKPLWFVANFFSVYLLFTAFEIYTLLLNLRHLNKKIKTRN
jgi:hypothetical protein